MNNQKYIPLIGRAFLSSVFLVAAIRSILAFDATRQMIVKQGLPVPTLLLIGNLACCIIGGLGLLLGFKARWTAILLILFLIPTTIIFHNPTNPEQINNFLKNLGIIGALLLIYYYGFGPISLDNNKNYD